MLVTRALLGPDAALLRSLPRPAARQHAALRRRHAAAQRRRQAAGLLTAGIQGRGHGRPHATSTQIGVAFLRMRAATTRPMSTGATVVTGAAGFIGSAVVPPGARRRPPRPRGSSGAAGAAANLDGLDVEIVEADLRDTGQVLDGRRRCPLRAARRCRLPSLGPPNPTRSTATHQRQHRGGRGSEPLGRRRTSRLHQQRRHAGAAPGRRPCRRRDHVAGDRRCRGRVQAKQGRRRAAGGRCGGVARAAGGDRQPVDADRPARCPAHAPPAASSSRRHAAGSPAFVDNRPEPGPRRRCRRRPPRGAATRPHRRALHPRRPGRDPRRLPRRHRRSDRAPRADPAAAAAPAVSRRLG